VKTDLADESALARLGELLVLGVVALLGFLLAGRPGAIAGAAVGAGVVLVLEGRALRRRTRRRAVLAVPFSGRARTVLLETYDHYDRLPPDWRRRFEDDVRIFVAEKRITGVEVEVTEELRLLVAASAVTVSLGWPDYEWDQLTEVLLYPQDFDRDYRFGASELAGQAHPWGTVILSVPSLRESFEDPDDGFHVGIHEFAHLLDASHSHFEGIPIGLDAARSREWLGVAEKEMDRLRRGRSVLDDYGAHDPVEFLAVAVEGFFEMPLALRRRHRELYELLALYFGQDPAAWDDARGLRL
jgi:Mlc titration factor MtfA (ptsG expression regulator)